MERWYIEKDSLDYILNLIRKEKIKSILEIGSGHAYSAINFGKVVEKVVTIEISEDRFKVAKENIKKSKVKNIEIVKGDAVEIISKIKEEFDLVFIDGTKREYLKYLQASLRVAKRFIIADNTISHEERMKDFIEEAKKYNAEFLDVGKGLAVIRV